LDEFDIFKEDFDFDIDKDLESFVESFNLQDFTWKVIYKNCLILKVAPIHKF